MAKPFNWDHLRSLIAIAKQGSISAAARAISVEHSTLSRHITALEERIGSKLFERTPSGTVLTAAGARLLDAAEAMQAVVTRAEEDISGQDMAVSGPVRIGAPEVVGAFLLAPRLAKLSKAHPNLSVHLAAMPHNFSLTKRETDMVVALSRPEQGELVSKKLSDYHLCAYASRDYIKSAAPIRELSDLRSHELINYTDDQLYSSYVDYLALVLPDVEARFQSSSMIAQLHATIEGLGICVLPHFLTRMHESLVPVLPSQTSLVRSWYLVYREDSRNLARIRVISDYLIEEFAKIHGLLTDANLRGAIDEKILAVDGAAQSK